MKEVNIQGKHEYTYSNMCYGEMGLKNKKTSLGVRFVSLFWVMHTNLSTGIHQARKRYKIVRKT